jgi:hypothetical protein
MKLVRYNTGMDQPKEKKHPCPDCSFCQFCSDSRCSMCLGTGCKKKCDRKTESNPEKAEEDK